MLISVDINVLTARMLIDIYNHFNKGILLIGFILKITMVLSVFCGMIEKTFKTSLQLLCTL